MRRAVAALSLGSVDLLLAVGVWLSARWVHIAVGLGPLSDLTYLVFVPGTVLWAGLRAAVGLYPGYGLSVVESLRRQSHATLVAGAVTVVFFYFLHIGDNISRLFVLAGFAGLLVLAPLARAGMRVLLRRGGLWGKPVLVVGEPEDAARVARRMREEWELGFVPVFPALYGSPVDEGDLYGHLASLRRRGVDTVIFAVPDLGGKRLPVSMVQMSYVFRHVIIVPRLEDLESSIVTARNLGGSVGIGIRRNLLDPWPRFVKRALDVYGVIMGGLLISPLLFLIALAVLIDSGWPVFYGHRRVGEGGRHFRCWKFRTMHRDADRLLEDFIARDPELQREWEQNFKLRRDPRVTRVGRFLRRTSLDELPQLINVLKGEMSLVGPRPIVDSEVVRYGEEFDLYRRVRPGISGLWQIRGRNDTSYAERVRLDSQYVRNWSIWLDLVILWRTVICVLSKRGAY